MDGTGSGSWAVAGFGISGVEPSGSATRELFRISLSSMLFPVPVHFRPIFSPYLSPIPSPQHCRHWVTHTTTCTHFLIIRIISFSYLVFVLAYCWDRPKASQQKAVPSVVTFLHLIDWGSTGLTEGHAWWLQTVSLLVVIKRIKQEQGGTWLLPGLMHLVAGWHPPFL